MAVPTLLLWTDGATEMSNPCGPVSVAVRTRQAQAGDLTVEQTETRKEAVVDARNKRVANLKKRRSSKTAPA
jgi:hypothetical protein